MDEWMDTCGTMVGNRSQVHLGDDMGYGRYKTQPASHLFLAQTERHHGNLFPYHNLIHKSSILHVTSWVGIIELRSRIPDLFLNAANTKQKQLKRFICWRVSPAWPFLMRYAIFLAIRLGR